MLVAAVLRSVQTRWLHPHTPLPWPERGMNCTRSVLRAGAILLWHPRLPSVGGSHPLIHPSTHPPTQPSSVLEA